MNWHFIDWFNSGLVQCRRSIGPPHAQAKRTYFALL
jgi:hypothetical protein